MNYETMQLTVEDGLARLVLNQPELGNPFNAAMCADMSRVATDLQRLGPDVRAVLLSASGKFFTVGGDIRMFVDQLDVLPGKIIEWTAGLHMGMARLKRLNAPLVASVHGVCMGAALRWSAPVTWSTPASRRSSVRRIRRSATRSMLVPRLHWPRAWASRVRVASCCSTKC